MPLIVSLILICSYQAWSHPLDMAYLEINGQELNLSVSKELPDKLGLTQNITDESLTGRLLFEKFFNDARLEYGPQICKTTLKKIDSNLTTQFLHVELSECSPTKELSLDFPVLKQMGFVFTVSGNYLFKGHKSLIFMSSDKSQTQVSTQYFNWWALTVSGFRHIGAHPDEWTDENGDFQWPDGIDHILFLLGLLLLTVGWRSLLLNATSFSLGHMASMILVTQNLLSASASVIEPVIALSIAATGLLFYTRRENLQSHKWIYLCVFLCGFVHGMGFANAFEDFGITETITKLVSILIFNIGVDIGQITVLLLLLAIYRLVHVFVSNTLYFNRALSVFLVLTGFGLFYDRVF